MLRWTRVVVVLLCVLGAASCSAQREDKKFDPHISYTGFVSASDASSFILVGGSQGERIFSLGGSWNLRESSGRWASWRYQAEVVPVAVMDSPFQTSVDTITYQQGATPLPYFPPGTFTSSGLAATGCYTGSGSGPIYSDPPTGNPVVIGTAVSSSTCKRVLTYGGGLSPLGEKVNFLPHQRLQPFLLVNAGFLAFTRNVPEDTATKFNFTAQGGGGLQWYVSEHRSLALDVRFHHFSNAFRGDTNPGIDTYVFRLSYSVSR